MQKPSITSHTYRNERGDSPPVSYCIYCITFVLYFSRNLSVCICIHPRRRTPLTKPFFGSSFEREVGEGYRRIVDLEAGRAGRFAQQYLNGVAQEVLITRYHTFCLSTLQPLNQLSLDFSPDRGFHLHRPRVVVQQTRSSFFDVASSPVDVYTGLSMSEAERSAMNTRTKNYQYMRSLTDSVRTERLRLLAKQ